MTQQHSHKHRPAKKAKKAWAAKSPAVVPAASQFALKTAMRLEGVAASEYDDLLWIMAQESGGVVGVRSKNSSARGLFQLLKMQYELNPNGEKSFGSAVEECQGGIHYIMGRYHSAGAARAFWEQNHWY